MTEPMQRPDHEASRWPRDFDIRQRYAEQQELLEPRRRGPAKSLPPTPEAAGCLCSRPHEAGAKADFRQGRDGFPAETIYLRSGPRYNSPTPFIHVIRGPAMTAPAPPRFAVSQPRRHSRAVPPRRPHRAARLPGRRPTATLGRPAGAGTQPGIPRRGRRRAPGDPRQYPLLDADAALAALDAAVRAYDHGQGLWPNLRVAERIQHVERFLARMREQREAVVKLLMWKSARTSRTPRKSSTAPATTSSIPSKR